MGDPLIYCLNLLKRRMRTRFELEEALTRRGTESEVRQTVLAELTQLGLIDDRQFAHAWVRTRDKLAPRGKFLLRAELAKKGIAEEIIQEVLTERSTAMTEEETEQPNELELAQRLVKSKERLYAGLSDEVRRRRLSAHLQRRGFSYEVIRRILDA